MYANNSGPQPLPSTGAEHGDVTRHRRRWIGRAQGALAASVLLIAACAPESPTATTEAKPTFSRAEGSSFVSEAPLASVGGLSPPVEKGKPWTIVGSIYDPERGTSTAASWTSDEGSRWKRTDIEPAASRTSESMAAITTSGNTLLAAGSVGEGPDSDAAIWRLSGSGWERIESEALHGEHEQWAFAATTGAGGTLVAGGENVWGKVRPRLWHSSDGARWEVVDGGADGPFDTTGSESVHAISAFGDGFVAVGTRVVDSDQDGIAWYSPDGRSWEQVDAPKLGGPGRQGILSLAPSGGTLVAGGYQVDGDGDGQPVVWTSTDGQSWAAHSAPLPLHDDDRTNAGDTVVRSITVDGDKLIAAGGSDWRPHLWRSSDKGKTWELLPNPVHGELFRDGVALTDAASHDSTVIALGLEPSVLRLSGKRWQDATNEEFPDGGVQPFASSVARSGDTAVLVGGRYTAARGDTREKYVGQVWLRNDGGWEPVESDAFEHGQVVDVTAYEGGFAAVGFEDFGVAAERKGISDNILPDAIIWTSKDGKSWERIAAERARIDEEDLEYLPDPDPENAAAIIAQMEAEKPPMSDPPAGGSGTHKLAAVDAIGKGFTAAGVRYDGDVAPIMLTSGDGKELTSQETGFSGPGAQQFRDVCVGPDKVIIAVGDSGKDGDYDVAVRHRDADRKWSEGTSTDKSFGGPGRQHAYGCAASDDGFIIVGSDDRSGDTDARIWTSPDGKDWSRLDDGSLGGAGDQWASAVAAVPDGGWLVGGTDTATGDGDIALWRVRDGEVSRRDRDEPELAGPGEQSVSKVLVDDDGVIIVGRDRGRVGVWETTTLDR